jgi:hypothetical protein
MSDITQFGPTNPALSIQMGDTVTVTFQDHGPTAPLTGIIRYYDDKTAALAVEEVGIALHIIKIYAYFTKSLV